MPVVSYERKRVEQVDVHFRVTDFMLKSLNPEELEKYVTTYVKEELIRALANELMERATFERTRDIEKQETIFSANVYVNERI